MRVPATADVFYTQLLMIQTVGLQTVDGSQVNIHNEIRRSLFESTDRCSNKNSSMGWSVSKRDKTQTK